MGTMRMRRAQLAGLLLLAGGCLELEDPAGRRCATDSDCREGRRCLRSGSCGTPDVGHEVAPCEGPSCAGVREPLPEAPSTQPPDGPEGAVPRVLLLEDFEAFPLTTPWPSESHQGRWTTEVLSGATVSVGEQASKYLTIAPIEGEPLAEAQGSVLSSEVLGDFDMTLQLYLEDRAVARDAYAGLAWHVSETGDAYSLRFSFGDTALIRTTAPGSEALQLLQPFRLREREWTLVRVRQVAAAITLWINDQKIADVTDPQPLPPGRLRLVARGDAVFFDDILVKQP